MSFTGLLRHRVLIKRRVAVLDGGGLPTYDELGQPVTQVETVQEERCRIEPLTAREVSLLEQGGAVVADHRVYFVAAAPVTTASQLVEQPGGRVLEVHKIDDLGGAGRYLEVLAQAIESPELELS